jgi:hypothetical protein
MIKKLAIVFFCFFSTISYSQKTLNLDELLSVKYSKKEIKTLKNSNIELYNSYLKSFTKGIILIPYDTELKAKGNKFETLKITTLQGSTFNYLEHKLELKNENQYFLINNGQTLLLIRGIQELNTIK